MAIMRRNGHGFVQQRHVLLVLVSVACRSPDSGSFADLDWTPQSIDTLATAADAEIGGIADLVIGGDARVWMADPQNHQLVLFDPASRVIATIGREGDGPGELRDPQALAAGKGAILVLQPRGGRLSQFTVAGQFVDSRQVAGRMLVPLSLALDSTTAAPSLGFENSLVAVVDLRTGERRLLGDALVEMPRMMSISGIRDQALRHEFPVEFRNNVLPVTVAGSVFLVSQYTGVVLRLTFASDTVWSSRLPLRSITEGHRAYFDAVRDEPGRIILPTVATHAEVVGSELWVAVKTGSGARILRFDARNGVELGSIELPGLAAGPFAVDLVGETLYVAVPSEALLVAASLPRSLLK